MLIVLAAPAFAQQSNAAPGTAPFERLAPLYRQSILVSDLVTNLPDSPRSVAWVQTVADVEGVMEQVQALGLELVPPLEFVSREAGKPGIETGVIDWDGHLVMFYGLKRDAGETP
jgi:hypothetical protein